MPGLPLVTEINLRGNPLGIKNIDPSDYIGALKKQFPELVCLDEQLLSENANIVTQQNYLCSVEAYDLIDQFINLYFESIDSPTKANLRSEYLKIFVNFIILKYFFKSYLSTKCHSDVQLLTLRQRVH